MSDLLLLALGASLVNNFVLTQFLGLCPFVGVSRRFEAAAGIVGGVIVGPGGPGKGGCPCGERS